MFNTNRPLVMYNSMSFEFSSLNFTHPMGLKLAKSTLDVEPKRANSFLYFDLFDGDKIQGQGIKKLVVAGLKPYQDEAINAFAAQYEARRDAFKEALS
ncbi:DUF3581 family protein [Psychromonas sp. KJ10-10]|uniref:DUF3581 family protein n=1 Tax=Psychromonas sp. KJ10-10 TaxID=3391823 RepID=UPI0039B67F02